MLQLRSRDVVFSDDEIALIVVPDQGRRGGGLRDGRRQRPRSGGVFSASPIPVVERLFVPRPQHRRSSMQTRLVSAPGDS